MARVTPDNAGLRAALDAYLEETAEILAHDLELNDIRHTCGEFFVVYWLDRDGQKLRWRRDMDQMEAILCAVCRNQRCLDGETRFCYSRLVIPGPAFYVADASNVFKNIAHQVEVTARGLREFVRGVEPPWDRAVRRSMEGWPDAFL